MLSVGLVEDLAEVAGVELVAEVALGLLARRPAEREVEREHTGPLGAPTPATRGVGALGSRLLRRVVHLLAGGVEVGGGRLGSGFVIRIGGGLRLGPRL